MCSCLSRAGVAWVRGFRGRSSGGRDRAGWRWYLGRGRPPACRGRRRAGSAANAIAHTSSGSPEGTFIVELTRRTTGVRITVYDCGRGATPRFGPRRDADPLAEGGRGLAVVAALASRVGFRGTQTKGHAVWAEIITV
ncbi:ATP-binding protein [Streptosporangium sp. NPDC049046]|uniref:ATP-binding protein n=1 Tax=Streptosporangium sp. NPDC049046 TaxID=3155031 RepID=UPI00344AB6F4